MELKPKGIARLTVDGQIVYYRPGEVIAIGEAAKRFVREELRALHPDVPRRHRPTATLPRHIPDGRKAETRASLARALDSASDVLVEAIEGNTVLDSLGDIREALGEVDRALESVAEATEDLQDLISRSREAVDAIEGDSEQAPERARNALEGLERAGDELTPLVSSLPPAFRFEGLDDPEAVVMQARARGLRVQLNHVFFSHGGCGCGCDPCCAGNPYGAFPYKATPYKATPYKATPYKATAPTRTSAVANKGVGREAVSQAPEAVSGANVWILDTGASKAGVPTLIEGVIDGDREDHPNEWPEAPRDDDLVDPVAGHGTFIAGIITQLAPGSRIWVSRLMRPNGELEEWEVADEIHRLLQNALTGDEDLTRTILNLSFGGALQSACNPLVGEAIAAAQEAGVVVVASAGNDASCLPVYPGNFPGVIAVGALDHDGDPANFTNRGTWVDACALGVDIVSTFFKFSDPSIAIPTFDDGWAIWSGTSFATPIAVAAIAHRITGTTTAASARDALLAEGTDVPCLGVRIDGDKFSDKLKAS